MSTTKRAHVLLPEDLIREIDALVGPWGRSSFLVETARQEVRRQRLLHFLEGKNSAWKNKRHPGLAEGAATWVRRLRAESDARGSALPKPKKSTREHTGRTAHGRTH